MNARQLMSAVSLWLLAGLQHVWIAPYLEKLPSDFTDALETKANTRVRETPRGAWEEFSLISKRNDQTLVSSSNHAIIQGDLRWIDANGRLTFELTGIYGVDRASRKNLPGYGNVDRKGYFLAPLHMAPGAYTFWDPFFAAPKVAAFNRETELHGLTVHEYRFTVHGIDETEGFLHLPDVPKIYDVHTDASGILWIEPVSGTLVDYAQSGKSYFVNKATGERVADCYIWDDHFTDGTRAGKREAARAMRMQIHILEIWLPLALLLTGLLILFWQRSAWKALMACIRRSIVFRARP